MLDTIRNILKESNSIVFITGLGSIVECKGRDIWESNVFYDIEERYHMAPEQLLSAEEYTSRKEYFFDFYKNEVLSYLPSPDETYSLIKKLEDEGKLDACISLNIFGLERLAGIEKVIELDGNVYDNYCPSCNKTFDIEYVTKSDPVPICDACKKALRPDIRLLGERMDNDKYTKACVACSNADAVIVLGSELSGKKLQYIIGHYKGSNLILLANEEHYSDKYADYVLYGSILDNLKNVLE